jgi:Mrp family chromosome partitioning ATPase
MDLADHFRVILHNWWRILLASLLVAGAVYYLSGNREDVFESNATMSVSSGVATSGSASSRDQNVFLAQTYAELATTRPVVAKAVKLSKLPIDIDTGLSRVSAEAASDTGFLTLKAQGPAPRAASRLANSLAVSLQEEVSRQQDKATAQDLDSVNSEIKSVQAELAQTAADAPTRLELETRYAALLDAAVARRTQPRDRVEVVSPAQPPGGPTSPRPTRDAVLGFVAALVILSELSVALYALGDRLPRGLDPESVAVAIGLPVLATVPRGSGASVVEAFRTLRVSLASLPPGQRPRSVAIVSPHEGAGKSFTSINLSKAAGAQQSGVLLIDGDLRRPVIHERLDIPRKPGLTDVLARGHVPGALNSVGVGSEYSVGEPRRFLVLPSGEPVQDPGAVLGNDAVQRVEMGLDSPPTLVVVDTPPAALFADAVAIATQCSAAILVLDAKKARLRSTRATIASLERGGVHLLGVVLNRAAGSRRRNRYSAYA